MPDTAPCLKNKLLAHFLRDAVALVEAKGAEAEAIDLAMRLGARHPVGPIELARTMGSATRDALGVPNPPESPARHEADQQPDVPAAWNDEAVGVVGTGFMASGISYAVAVAGQRVIQLGRSADALEGSRKRIAESLQAAVDRGRLENQAPQDALDRIEGTLELSGLRCTSLVIEAVTEDLATKRRIFAELDAALPRAELIASNTSSLTVHEIAAALPNPARTGALHFFSPVPAMRLVEVAQSEVLPDELVARAAAWVRSIGKVPVVCADRAGFIVNSLLIPFLNDVARAQERGLGTPEELDRIMVEQAGHPMGPFQLIDMIGVDVFLAAQRSLSAARPGVERLRPASTLTAMVDAGRLGRKAGRGFYDYTEQAALA